MHQSDKSPGRKLREALEAEKPLQIVGTINAFTAIMAKRAGFRAVYLSGAGVANASFGLPDLGITTLSEVAREARRITDAVDLPLLVDIDTGFGTEFSIARTIRTLEKDGAAGIHIEDQEAQKRCGHRPNKVVVPPEEMCARIRAAVDARKDPDFMIIARTDAFALEGLEGALSRARKYIRVGADAVFPEALTGLEQYTAFAGEVPVLANITEFGITPLFTLEELRNAGVSIALYPLSAFRAMNKAADQVYRVIREKGTQKSLINTMQTREELYDLIDYYRYEEMVDKLYEGGHGKTKRVQK
ncbi:MAG: methylisocitrate lyase [Candidatus Methanoperedens sp.]|nr:methylisocitrate lyase [Candidatus Methanoperedens sp.]